MPFKMQMSVLKNIKRFIVALFSFSTTL